MYIRGGEFMSCLGCNLANKNQPVYVILENDYVSCFLDHIPFNEGHILILPKKHFYDVDELDERTANEIMKVSIIISKALKKLYNPDGIIINQNGGIFNELKHYHMHVVPLYKEQSFATFYSEYDSNNIEQKDRLKKTQRDLLGVINTISSH